MFTINTNPTRGESSSIASGNYDSIKETLMYRNRKRPSGGFTLIEVLLVLVILVVLASLAVVAYGPIQKKMRINAARTQIGLFKTALGTYELDVGTYPPNLDALRNPPGDVPPEKYHGPYLDSDIPPDPWGKPYQYSPTSQHNLEYDVWTVDPNGVEIGNWTRN
jgi:general secretion pathway protein G